MPGVLCMAGTTSSYAVDPVGESVIGIVTAGAMRAHRGGDRYVFRAGQMCVWDASRRHDGRPHTGVSWRARLLVLELPTVEDLLADPDGGAVPVVFPGPAVDDRRFADRFVALHRALENPAAALAGETALLELLLDLAASPPGQGRLSRPVRDPALRRACEVLRDEPCANITLTQLAAAAGVSRHRLTRLFRAAYGVPPHRFQLAQRLQAARRLLEQGLPASAVALRAGFTDQSHLHRHFQRALGMTPGRYARLVRSNVQDRAAGAP